LWGSSRPQRGTAWTPLGPNPRPAWTFIKIELGRADASLVHACHAIDETEREIHVVFDQKHREFPRQRADDVADHRTLGLGLFLARTNTLAVFIDLNKAGTHRGVHDHLAQIAADFVG
jgi:hypothetical protein